MPKQTKLQRFESLILPHMGAAYNLARWIMGNEQDAQDVVQDAYMRAFRNFDKFTNTNSTGWMLTIVRNTCYTSLKRERGSREADVFDEHCHSMDSDSTPDAAGQRPPGPEDLVLAASESARVRAAVYELPVEFREGIVLRELEGFTYQEIADIAGIPLGTVMSRLSRARKQLQPILAARFSEVTSNEL